MPALFLAALLTTTSGPVLATAATFDTDTSDAIKVPLTSECPTISDARYVDVWFNTDDMDARGVYDKLNQTPWDFPKRFAQILCGAREGAEIKIGMFFIRAIGTMTQPGLKSDTDPASTLGTRPESDPEVIYDALEYLVKYRNVKIGLVLDGGGITPGSAKALISKRLQTIAGISGVTTAAGVNTYGVEWCKNGCFNASSSSKTWPYAINHEKFVTISDTIWDGASGSARSADSAYPVVMSSSGNWARSQIRNYMQEVTVIYGDRTLFQRFSERYDGMAYCAHKGGNAGCTSNTGFPGQLKYYLTKQRGIWVDRFTYHGGDQGTGTSVTFSPQPLSVVDPYIQAFDGVDCVIDTNIRIAMFKMTDSKAQKMVAALKRLKSRGCNVKVLLTQQGGSTTISKSVVKVIKKSHIWAKCTPVPMHTKVIIIGPKVGNEGRVLHGTANMSTSGLRYSEEHTITINTKLADTAHKGDVERAYGFYLTGWYELSQGAKTCH